MSLALVKASNFHFLFSTWLEGALEIAAGSEIAVIFLNEINTRW